MAITDTVIPLQSLAHSATTGQTTDDHHGESHTVAEHSDAPTSIDNEIARYTGVAGAIQAYTSGGPTISDTGVMLKSAQPSFLAHLTAAEANVTGVGTWTSSDGADNWTEIFDQANNFDGDGTFTAPVTGRYRFDVTVLLDGRTAAATLIDLTLVTSNRNYRKRSIPVGSTAAAGVNLSVFADMDANDTAHFTINAQGEASDVQDVLGGTDTLFAGHLAH